jgi:cyclopropane fatty-acyl-phospholipid synthase-like methyltransferase
MTIQNEWWQTFYSGHYVDFHQEAVSKKQTAEEVDFMLKLLQLPPKASVLDLGCGEGRHTIEMAKRGYRMTAVDVTEPLLDIARANAAKQALDIDFEQRDMRSLPWENTFNAAYCVWGSFGVFDEKGNLDLLKSIAQVLIPDGRLIIENHSMETILMNFQTTHTWQLIENNLFRLEERYFDHTTSRLESTWIFVDQSSGQTEKQALSMRIYTYHELCQLLQSAGFDNFAGYDTISGKPFALGAQRLTLIATKSEL